MPLSGMQAGEDLTDKQFHAVKLSAAWTISAIDAATDVAIGILMDAPKEGEGASVAVGGDAIIKAKAGGTIAVNGKLKINAAGELVAISTTSGADENVIAIALETAADHDLFFVKVVDPYIHTVP